MPKGLDVRIHRYCSAMFIAAACTTGGRSCKHPQRLHLSEWIVEM